MSALLPRSLSVVGDVPEFKEGRAKLAALEDRLQRRVEGRLADALEAQQAAEVSAPWQLVWLRAAAENLYALILVELGIWSCVPRF